MQLALSLLLVLARAYSLLRNCLLGIGGCQESWLAFSLIRLRAGGTPDCVLSAALLLASSP